MLILVRPILSRLFYPHDKLGRLGKSLVIQRLGICSDPCRENGRKWGVVPHRSLPASSSTRLAWLSGFALWRMAVLAVRLEIERRRREQSSLDIERIKPRQGLVNEQ